MKNFSIIILVCCPLVFQAQIGIPKPSKAQLAWHEMEFYLFMHFGPNTFTDLEWGHGTEKEEVFNPTDLDCEQWCRIAKAAGAKGIIITAKHHDGFCLWPSKYSKHTVRESKWKDGKGDVLKDLSEACKKYGLKFGVYISPWDRNHPDYGTEKYNDVFVNMMKEIFANYGPIWELWWDGANGEGPNGKKQVYDWHRFERTVRELSPNTVVFSDIGPDVRWCGNEDGIAGKTNWNTLDTAGFKRGAGGPPQDTLNAGNVNGRNWIPAECDVSIRPGWFYHKAEDSKVKMPEQLFNLYLKSVGRGANLLLNVPPDGRGLINENDSAALVGFRNLLEMNFSKRIKFDGVSFRKRNGGRFIYKECLNDDKSKTFVKFNHDSGIVRLYMKTGVLINCVVFKENLKKGQHISSVKIEFAGWAANNEYRQVKTISTIGKKRILTFPAIYAKYVTITLISQGRRSRLSEVEAYLIDEKLVEK
ncbi:MAG: alpha-L-fucosidase [Chitinophagaceae bacterium]|nr:alpha-L-fucosidase [Chitinophagaceae bacterium]